METNSFDTTLQKQKIIFIIRNPDPKQSLKAVRTVWKNGGKLVEVTCNSPGCADILKELSKEIPEGAFLGAGTVKDKKDLESVLQSGISFVVTPIVSNEVIAKAKSEGILCISGASTPTEIHHAWSLGSNYVKVFPANNPAYIKMLKGPFDSIPLIAVGGVREANFGEFLAVGAMGVAFGASFFEFERSGGFQVASIEKKIRKVLKITESLG